MKVAVLTAGGVAPGMNAAVRAVAQAAFSRGWEVLGIEDGFEGILEERFHPVDRGQLAGLMHRGGTVLGSGRSKEVRETEGQERAARMLDEAGVEALIIIGGGGSLTSAKALGEAGVKAVGIPATIDNDVPGTELALGVDSALEARGSGERSSGLTITARQNDAREEPPACPHCRSVINHERRDGSQTVAVASCPSLFARPTVAGRKMLFVRDTCGRTGRSATRSACDMCGVSGLRRFSHGK